VCVCVCALVIEAKVATSAGEFQCKRRSFLFLAISGGFSSSVFLSFLPVSYLLLLLLLPLVLLQLAPVCVVVVSCVRLHVRVCVRDS